MAVEQILAGINFEDESLIYARVQFSPVLSTFCDKTSTIRVLERTRISYSTVLEDAILYSLQAFEPARALLTPSPSPLKS
jgi:hypothetical protein